MTVYDDFAALANELLAVSTETFGELGAIRRRVSLGSGPSDLGGAFIEDTDYPCNLALFPVDQKDIDGTFIKSGDWRAMVAPAGLTITPTPSDVLVCSAGNLTIVDPGRFAPAGTVTHYRMLVRK